MAVKSALQLHIGEEEDSQDRKHVQKQQKEPSDVCDCGDSDYEGLEDDLYLLRLLDEFENTRHAQSSDESGRGSKIELHCY